MPNDIPDWSGEVNIAELSALVSSELTVGVAAVSLAPIFAQSAIILKADSLNTGTVYVSPLASVSATDWPLAAGETLAMDAGPTLYLLGSAAGQVVHVMQGS